MGVGVRFAEFVPLPDGLSAAQGREQRRRYRDVEHEPPEDEFAFVTEDPRTVGDVADGGQPEGAGNS
jgi:hypothetical protein